MTTTMHLDALLKLLTEHRLIAHLWGVEDVREVRPDLTADLAWEVLQACDARPECTQGLTWDGIARTAEELYPLLGRAYSESRNAATSADRAVLVMTAEEFAVQYPLLVNPFNPDAAWSLPGKPGCLFETQGHELSFVRQQDPRTLWTLVDGDDGHVWLRSGVHRVNRLGYLVSTRPIPDGAVVAVRLAADDADEEATESLTVWAEALAACIDELELWAMGCDREDVSTAATLAKARAALAAVRWR